MYIRFRELVKECPTDAKVDGAYLAWIEGGYEVAFRGEALVEVYYFHKASKGVNHKVEEEFYDGVSIHGEGVLYIKLLCDRVVGVCCVSGLPVPFYPCFNGSFVVFVGVCIIASDVGIQLGGF